MVHTGTAIASTASTTRPAVAGNALRPRWTGTAARGAPAPIRAYLAFPRAGRLGDQQHQTQQHENAGQHAARRSVERDLELLEDRDGEGVEPDHGEGAVFGEQMDADQQATAQDRQPQLRQHHAEEHAGGIGSEGTGRFLDRPDRAGAASRQRADT